MFLFPYSIFFFISFLLLTDLFIPAFCVSNNFDLILDIMMFNFQLSGICCFYLMNVSLRSRIFLFPVQCNLLRLDFSHCWGKFRLVFTLGLLYSKVALLGASLECPEYQYLGRSELKYYLALNQLWGPLCSQTLCVLCLSLCSFHPVLVDLMLCKQTSRCRFLELIFLFTFCPASQQHVLND